MRTKSQNKWEEKHPEKVRGYKIRWRKNNPDAYKNWYKENREQKLAYGKLWREKNKDKIRKDWKLWVENNKNHRKKWKRNYEEKRMETDINYKLISRLRIRLIDALKGKSKSKSTIELLGCTIPQLKQHLQKQFKRGMTWKNYGKWHLDHIKSCYKFDLAKPEEQKECFHYTNLQPLWAIENLKKGKK